MSQLTTMDHDRDPNDEDEDIIRAKWMMDGATTLIQAAEQLEDSARRLRKLADQGWCLRGPVEDDYGTIYRPRRAKPARKRARRI